MTSSVSSTSGNRVSGLASGIDTDSIIKKILKSDYAKLDRANQRVQLLEWQRDIYREANSKLLKVRNAAQDLKLPSVFQSKLVKSSNQDVVTATATGDAVNGVHTIIVNSVMTGVNRISTSELAAHQSTLATQFGLTGTVSFVLTGKDNIARTYSFDTATKSIDNVVSDINANAANSGINVGYSAVGNRFILSTADTGSTAVMAIDDSANNFLSGTLKLDLSGGTVVGTTNTLKGTDTVISYDGASGITFTSNTFTLNDVNYTVTKAGTATVTISNDVDKAYEKIKAFVDVYNEAIGYIDGKVGESRIRDSKHQIKYPPLTDDQKEDMTEDQIKKWEEQAKVGILGNDDTLRSLSYKLRVMANGILTNQVNDITTTAVNLESKASLPVYGSTLLNQFGVAGNIKFNLTGKDGTEKTYSFDSTSQSILDIARTINENTSTTGIKAEYDFAGNSFRLFTPEEGLNSKITVDDTTGFLRNQLKLDITSPASQFSTAALAPSASTLAAQFGLYGTVGFTLTGKDAVPRVYSFATGSKSMSDMVNVINANTTASGIYASYASNGFNLYTTGTGTSATMQIADTNSFLRNKLNLNLTTGVNLFSTASVTANAANPLAGEFGLAGNVSFTLTGKDSVDQVYTFDTTTQNINDILTAINANTATSGIRAVYSGNGFNLTTTDMNDDGVIKVVDTDSFLKNSLKLGIYSGATYTGVSTSNTTNEFTGTTNSSSNLTNAFTGTQTSSLSDESTAVEYMKYRSLSAVGIATEGYIKGNTDNSKLYISESVLKNALASFAEDVYELFNATQSISNGDGTTTQKNVGFGLTMYDLARTSISALTTKAGISGSSYDNSDIANLILEEDEAIDKLKDRLTEREDYWYARFTAMEKAIQRSNEQSSWLSQQFAKSS